MGIKSTGFLHLLDWNKKPRKKLFANGIVSPEVSNQDPKDNVEVKLSNQFIKDSGTTKPNDQNCASSVIDGEDKGTKTPGVVAKLMGLDSFPTSGVSESCSPPFFHSQSLLQNFYLKKVPEINIGDNFNSSRKMSISPMERLSTEMLSVRSVKSASTPFKKIISPVKNPTLSSGRNADRIVEPTIKIIEQGLGEKSKGKAFSLGYSEKELYSDHSIIEEPCSVKASSEWEETSSTSIRCNRKTVSLAVQAKVNVQRREVLSVSRESGDIKPISKNRSLKNASKPVVLKQNSLKQNVPSSNKKMTAKLKPSNQQMRGIPSEDVKHGKNRTQKKIQGNPNPPKKRLIKVKDRSEENTVIVGSHKRMIEDSRRTGTDIVSFTFTSPIVKSSERSLFNHTMKQDLICSSNLNVISGDALSILLERKLKELSQELETSTEVESASVSFPDLSSLSEKETVHELGAYISADDQPSVSGRPFNDSSTPEGTESIDEVKKKLGQQHLSPQSILEATFSSESCSNSSESCDGSRLETRITEIDLLDSAFSETRQSSAAAPSEIEYVMQLVNYSDLDSTADRSLDLSLFDLLEEQIAISRGKIERKTVFDCVEDWLSMRRWQNLESGGFVLLPEKEELAEQICRDLSWWRGMGDWMVDELVAVDMSFGPGRWTKFPTETFEKVVELEKSLVCNLLEEVLSECQFS